MTKKNKTIGMILLSSLMTTAFAKDNGHTSHMQKNQQSTTSCNMMKHDGTMQPNTKMMHHGNSMQHDNKTMQHCMDGMNVPSAESFNLPTGLPLNTLPILKNESKQAHVFAATLKPTETAVNLVPNRAPTKLWLYNGTLLPVIDVNVGDEVQLTLANNLIQDTTIHWHGLAVPAEQDGNPHDPIKPGQSHPYQFKISQQMAGSHWFHPHTHNLVAEQVYRGLAGLFIIRNPNDPLKNIPEQNLFFSDLKLDAEGQIAPNSMMDEMNGREGQFALLNGGLQPNITLNGTQRWRLWNGNSGRYLNLAFPADQVDAYLVGNDGGLLETPQKIETILMTPGERAEIVLTPKQNGKFELIAKKYNRQKMGNVAPEEDRLLATVTMQQGQTISLPKQLRTIEPLGEPTVKRKVVYTEDNKMNFLVNGKAFDMNRIDITTKVKQVEEWEIFNNSHMDHNFHLHGNHFIVKEYELNGKITKPTFTLLKDTINLKPYEKIRIITRQDEAGLRMFHCHILEHENAGMMGQVEVK